MNLYKIKIFLAYNYTVKALLSDPLFSEVGLIVNIYFSKSIIKFPKLASHI